MKIHIFVVMLTFLSCSNTFYEKVLNDISTQSPFISITLRELDGTLSDIIVKNDDLYFYLIKKKDIEKYEYIDFLNDLLMNSKPLVLNESMSDKMRFTKVDLDKSVENISKKGKNYFVEYFFKGTVMNEKVTTDNQINSIIKKLFEWEIQTTIDDESGYLIIVE